MPEIRCPMCSKPNPEDNEVCQFCQARLKPLIAGQTPDEAPRESQPQPPDKAPRKRQPHPPPPVSSPTEDLSRLRSQYEELLPDLFPSEEDDAVADIGAPAESSYEEPETSDEYLGRLGAVDGMDEVDPSQKLEGQEPEAQPDEPVPEWLARIRQKEGDKTKAGAQPEEDGDWLNRLRQKEEGQPDAGEEQPLAEEPIPDHAETGEPLGGTQDARPPSLESEARDEADTGSGWEEPAFEAEIESSPDWFSESVPAEDDGDIEPVEPDQIPGWLAEARQEGPKDVSGPEEPTPDWMAGVSPAGGAAGGDEGELGEDVGPFASGAFEDQPAQEGEADKTPSWLADELEGGPSEIEEEGSLSWLDSEVDVDLSELDSGAFMAAEQDEDVEIPGWLADAVDPTKAPGTDSVDRAEARMAGRPPQGEAGSTEDGQVDQAAKAGETPLGPPSKPFIDGTVEPESQPDISWDALKEQPEPSSDLDVPSRPFVQEPQAEPAQPAEEQQDLGLPAWLDEIREAPPEPEEPVEEKPALIMGPRAPRKSKPDTSGLTLDDLELPEWIGEMRDEAASSGEGAPELAPATLPTWLEAMRPIESFKSDQALIPEEDQSVESIGPLAGLRGVLAAEPIMAMPRTATIGGARLEVNEQQYARAELLARMVQEEKQEQAGLKPKRRRIPFERLLVTLALLAALFFSLPGSDDAAASRFLAPENQPQSLNNLYDLVLNAPLDRPVLVVFDYSPAFAGELETYATPLLADIVNRDLKIITVSTHPTGPPLAARMLQNVSGERDLQNTRDYLHFGYLSGGPTAVQLFAANPRQALLYGFQLPVDTQTTDIWSYPIVEHISQLSDFGLLVVITAGTDSARTWVEQAGPYLGDTPLALVLSAGVEPLLQPYAIGVEPQVDNILSGLSVANVYEGYMGLEGAARTNWDAFGSMLTVVELILIGGAIYGLVSYILRAMGVVKV